MKVRASFTSITRFCHKNAIVANIIIEQIRKEVVMVLDREFINFGVSVVSYFICHTLMISAAQNVMLTIIEIITIGYLVTS